MGRLPGWQPGRWVSFLVETDPRQGWCCLWSDAACVSGGNTHTRAHTPAAPWGRQDTPCPSPRCASRRAAVTGTMGPAPIDGAARCSLPVLSVLFRQSRATTHVEGKLPGKPDPQGACEEPEASRTPLWEAVSQPPAAPAGARCPLRPEQKTRDPGRAGPSPGRPLRAHRPVLAAPLAGPQAPRRLRTPGSCRGVRYLPRGRGASGTSHCSPASSSPPGPGLGPHDGSGSMFGSRPPPPSTCFLQAPQNKGSDGDPARVLLGLSGLTMARPVDWQLLTLSLPLSYWRACLFCAILNCSWPEYEYVRSSTWRKITAFKPPCCWICAQRGDSEVPERS